MRITTRALMTTAHQRNGNQMAMTNQITTVTQNRMMDRRKRHVRQLRARDVYNTTQARHSRLMESKMQPAGTQQRTKRRR